ncbi:MAG: GGDEF domain-containing protein [Clostridia bacterium]|nr:GGDEF domain-containing protein [Clostridia bacterium]
MLSGKRKTIGAFLCKAYSLFDNAVYRVLEEEAKHLDYNIIVFTTVGYFASQNYYDQQERAMFSFAPIEELDGILVAPDTYEIDGFRDELMNAIRERARCPVVAVRHISQELDCVHTDEKNSISPLLEHLLDYHKLKKIRFLAGYEGHPDSENRLNAYRKAMASHGLTVDEEKDIAHGNMWYNCGPGAYKALFSDPEDWPEAVVCANDYMAAGLIREMLKNNIRIPEDVIVTGFDNVPSLNLEELKLTTVEQDFTGMARAAIRELDRQIRTGDSRNTREENVSIDIPAQLVLSESCGCGKRDHHYYAALNKSISQQLEALSNREVGMTYLSIEMGGCDDLNQMHRVLIEKKSDTPQLQDLYICLFENGRNEKGEPAFAKEMTDTVCLVHVMKDKQDCRMPMVSFDRKQILPALAERPEPQVLYLMGLHQNEFAYGYALFHYYPDQVPSQFFQHFNIVLSGALSNIHKRNEILALYEERRLSSITDVMTHLLNRRGLEERILPDWPGLCARREYMTFITFDMDHLKEINDTYGHQAGDFAIRAMAQALHAAALKDTVTARMGGDEFLTVLSGADQRAADEFIRRFRKELAAINERERRSFQVEASCGTVVIRLDEMKTLEQCIRMSDEAMYSEKEKHHQMRH